MLPLLRRHALTCQSASLPLQECMNVVGRLLDLKPSDLLLHGDVDELPYASAVSYAANMVWNSLDATPKVVPVVDFDLRWVGV